MGNGDDYAIKCLVSGTDTSGAGYRARQLFGNRGDVQFIFRHNRGLKSILEIGRYGKPAHILYVLDLTLWSGIATFNKTATKLIIDIGDVVYYLSRYFGDNVLTQWAKYVLEQRVLDRADHVVVRSVYHKNWLGNIGIENVSVIPDGVDMTIFFPQDAKALRHSLNISDDQLVVGCVGSTVWSRRLGWSYGLELVEALALTNLDDIIGVIVGDGSGLEYLKARANELRISSQLRFVHSIPYERLPQFINMFDIALSTQTNNIVGNVRTTGKLPLYMACGKFVLASRVGTAKDILPSEMLVDYDNVGLDSIDHGYPERLAARVMQLYSTSSLLRTRWDLVEIAGNLFEVSLLSRYVNDVLDKVGHNE